MPNRNKNCPNALKHGAFAKTAILPGEDRQEFEELHAALVEEWTPVGPTEEDAVLSIAQGVWRKRRGQKFLQADIERGRLDPDHPAYDEAFALEFISECTRPEELDKCLMLLSKRNVEYLQQKCAREKFQSDSEWVHAVQHEITSVLLPRAERRRDLQLPEDLLYRSALNYSESLIKLELGMDERIDGMIDRAIKRLIQTKAMKQMLGPLPPTGGDGQHKKTQSRKSNGSVNHRAG